MASASEQQQQAGDDKFLEPGPVAASSRAPKRKRMFVVRHMMYGFGDTPVPATDTLELMEELVIEYITSVCSQAAEHATKRGKLQTRDLLFVLRKDTDKIRRVAQLLNMNKELKRARRAFEVDPKTND